MTAAEVKALPVRDKLQIREAIWEDFRERFETADLSESQMQLLNERRARVANGSVRLVNWDDVKDCILFHKNSITTR